MSFDQVLRIKIEAEVANYLANMIRAADSTVGMGKSTEAAARMVASSFKQMQQAATEYVAVSRTATAQASQAWEGFGKGVTYWGQQIVDSARLTSLSLSQVFATNNSFVEMRARAEYADHQNRIAEEKAFNQEMYREIVARHHAEVAEEKAFNRELLQIELERHREKQALREQHREVTDPSVVSNMAYWRQAEELIELNTRSHQLVWAEDERFGRQAVATAEKWEQQKLQIGKQYASSSLEEHRQQLAKEQTLRDAEQAKLAEQASSIGAFAAAHRQAFMVAGAAMAAFGAGVTETLKKSAQAAVGWESAFAGVRKTVDMSEAGFARLSDQLRALATATPLSHETLAGIAEMAGQLGVANEDILTFTQTVVKLSVATNMSANDAATAMARFTAVMGLGGAEVDKVASSLVHLGNNSAATESEILTTAQRMAAAGKIAGFTAPQLLGIAAAMKSVGINTELGGTAFSRVVTDITKTVETGGKKLEAYASIIDLTGTEFAKAWKNNPAETFNIWIQGLSHIKETGGSAFAALDEVKMNAVRVASTLLSLSEAGGLMSDRMNMSADAWNNFDAATLEAEKRFTTLESQMQIAKNSIHDSAISLGQVFMPAIAGAAHAVADFFSAIAALPPTHQKWAAGIMTTVAAVTTLGGGLIALLPQIRQVHQALTALKAAGKAAEAATSIKIGAGIAEALTSPWMAAAALGVAAIGAAFYATGKQAKEAAALVDQWRDAIQKANETTISTLEIQFDNEGLRNRLAELFVTPVAGGEQLIDVMHRLGVDGKTVLDALTDGGKQAAQWLSESHLALSQAFDSDGMQIISPKEFQRARDLDELGKVVLDNGKAIAEAERQQAAEIRAKIAAQIALDEAVGKSKNINDEVAKAIAHLGLSSQTTARAITVLDAEMEGLTEEQKKFRSDEMIKQIEAVAKAAVDAAMTFIDFNKTLYGNDDSYDGLDAFITRLNRQADDLEEWQANLDKMKDLGLPQELIDFARNYGVAGAPLVAEIVSQESVDKANAAADALNRVKTLSDGAGDEAAAAFLSHFAEPVEPTVEPKLNFDNADAILSNWLAQPRHIQVQVNTLGPTFMLPNAAGGFLTGFPTGGFLPGIPPADPMADNILGMSPSGVPVATVRSREFVVTQSSADYYGDLLWAINSRAIPREVLAAMVGRGVVHGFAGGGPFPGLAGGGTVSFTDTSLLKNPFSRDNDIVSLRQTVADLKASIEDMRLFHEAAQKAERRSELVNAINEAAKALGKKTAASSEVRLADSGATPYDEFERNFTSTSSKNKTAKANSVAEKAARKEAAAAEKAAKAAKKAADEQKRKQKTYDDAVKALAKFDADEKYSRTLDFEERRLKYADDELKYAEARLEQQTKFELQMRRSQIFDTATGGLSGAQSLTDQLRSLADNTTLDFSKPVQEWLRTVADVQEKAFTDLYTKAENLDKKLGEAREKLQDLASINAEAASAIAGGFKLSDVFQTDKDGHKTFSGTGSVAAVSGYLAGVKLFAVRMSQLQQRGFAGVILKEIAAMGVQDGIIAADALLSLSESDVSQMNSGYGAITAWADAAGEYVTQGFANGGYAAAHALVAGLESERSSIEVAIANIAVTLENAISKVFANADADAHQVATWTGGNKTGAAVKVAKKAYGGFLPGIPPTDPMADNILGVDEAGLPTALVRSREFVVQQSAADYYDNLLWAINSRAIPRELLASLVTGNSPSRRAVGGRISGLASKANVSWANLANTPFKMADGTLSEPYAVIDTRSKAAVKYAQEAQLAADRNSAMIAVISDKVLQNDLAAIERDGYAWSAAKEAEAKAEEARKKAEAESKARAEAIRSLELDISRGRLVEQAGGSLSGAQSLSDRLRTMAYSEQLGLAASVQQALLRTAEEQEAVFSGLFKQAEAIDKSLKDAKEKAQEITGIAKSAASAVSGGFKLADASKETITHSANNGQSSFVWKEEVNSSATGMLAKAEEYAAKAQTFAKALNSLQQRGFTGPILAEIAGMGVEKGIQAADALLSLSTVEVSRMNTAYKSIETWANNAGQYVSAGFFDGGKQAADEWVKGLESERETIKAAIEATAVVMQNALKQALSDSAQNLFAVPWSLNASSQYSSNTGSGGLVFNLTQNNAVAESNEVLMNRAMQLAATMGIY